MGLISNRVQFWLGVLVTWIAVISSLLAIGYGAYKIYLLWQSFMR